MAVRNPPNINHDTHDHPSTPAAREACRKEVWAPITAGEQMEIRRTVHGKTVSYVVEAKNLSVGGPDILLNAQVVGVAFSRMTDIHLDNQRQSIDRLLDHLRHDCPELSDAASERGRRACTYAAGIRNQERSDGPTP